MRKLFAIILSVLMILSLTSVVALADTSGAGAKQAPQRDAKPQSIDYGSRYNHIDVKTDALYSFSIDGVPGAITGSVVASSITVRIGNTTYSGFSQSPQQEVSHYEFTRKITATSPQALGLTWMAGTYKPTNVYVSMKIIFPANVVPADLKPHLTLEADDSYSVTLANHRYDGVQECTGGNGMRSEGNTGTPTGLDLYINVTGMTILTKGKLGIEKKVVDENGTFLENDAAEFEYTLTHNGAPVYFVNNVYTANSAAAGATSVVKVRNGQHLSLTGLPAGIYTVTETQKDGYIIRDIDGQASTTSYSKDYVVVNKDDANIPVANFTNTKLSEQTGVNVNKTASGLPQGSRYPNPTVSIYALDAQGNKTGNALFTGMLDANGDTLYLTALFSPGAYIVEETGADVNGYDLATTLMANGQTQNGMMFTVTANDKGKRISLTVNNVYSEQPGQQNGRLTITKYLAGDLSVNKEGQLVAQDGTIIPSTFLFTFTLYKDNTPVEHGIVPVFVPATETAPAKWVATVDKLEPGSYTVEEEYAELFNYDLAVAYAPTGGTVTVAANQTANVSVTNTYTRQKQISLVHPIEKLVTADASLNSPTGDRTFYFDVEIFKTGPTDRSPATTLPFDVSVTGDFKKSNDPSKGDFMVTINGAGQASGNIVIKGTPDEFEMLIEYNAYFIIRENDTGIGQDWTYDIDKIYHIYATYDDEALNYRIELNNQAYPAFKSIKFVNTYKNDKTGVVLISKQLSGDNVNPNDEFTFRFALSYPPNIPPLTLTYTKYDANGNLVDRGELGAAFTLKGGESIMIYGIRLGILYTVTETDSKDYTVTYTNRTGTLTLNKPTAEVTVTNTRNHPIEKTTSVTVTKRWDDNNNKEGKRPSSVTVWLCRNGVILSRVELSAANNWTWTWRELDAKQRWTVEERDVPTGYHAIVTSTAYNSYVITNHLSQKPNISTGDSTHLLVSGALLAAAGITAAVLLGKKRRRRSSR